ncbi:MAG: short-chain dehydrogenase [Acidobacteria bacterium]|nr:MAG: short-chain dehydrogenase [Acidobacteriota bacterium]
MEPVTHPFRLDGRIALITGGSSGIGEATARAFTRAGAAVIIMSIEPARAQAVAGELANSRVILCDITDEAAVAEAFRGIGRLDILVNNAGIGLVGNVEETSLGDFQRLFRVNVEGMFLVTRAALPLIKASHGSIINIGSVAGMIGVRRRFAYCATKGAVIALTKQLAVDYPAEFRVNCICPGTIDTPFVEGFLEKYHKHEKDKVRQELKQRQPVGRLGRPEEVAALALYLASEESAFMNGAALPIDGGWSAA